MGKTQTEARANFYRFSFLAAGLVLVWVAAGAVVRNVLLDRYKDYHAKVRAHAPTDAEISTSADLRLNQQFAEAYEELQGANVLTAAYFAWKQTIYT